MRWRMGVIVWLSALVLVCCSRPPRAGSDSYLKFTVPPDWIQEDPASPPGNSRYRLPHAAGDSEDGELTITYSGDPRASAQKTIDSWTALFEKTGGEPTIHLLRREINGIPLTVLDVTGTYLPPATAAQRKPGFRMLAAIAETEHGPWFFRLIGPANTVSDWGPSFVSFLDTIR